MILSSLFPEGISSYFTEDRKDANVLTTNERTISATYGSKRLADFCTGRYCLRQSTSPLGFEGEILIGERGMPLLPAHITASISHSKTMCGAIAAHKEQYISLGFDIETNGRVHKDMWHLLFTENETDYLNSLGENEQNLTSTIFFSLKEAYYKMQYPLTGTFLDFPEVEVLADNDTLAVKLLREVNERFITGHITPGYIIQHENQVITYCTIPA